MCVFQKKFLIIVFIPPVLLGLIFSSIFFAPQNVQADVSNTSVTVKTAVCGNGVRAGGEQCDGADLAGQTCVNRGYDSGTLSCKNDCTFDTSNCVITPTSPPSGGGGLPPGAYNPPASPTATPEAPAGFSVLINSGAEYTNSRDVVLKLNGGPDAKKMAISENADFYGAGQEPYQTTKTWTLTENDGAKTIYAKFYTQYGQSSSIVSDKIIYQSSFAKATEDEEEKPVIDLPEIIKKISKGAKEISKKIEEIIKEIPEVFKPKQPEEIKPEEIPVEELVPKQAPTAFQGKYDLLTYTLQNKPFVKFTLAPLPKEIRVLAQKFPEFRKTLKKIGITKITDVEKLKTVKLTLPGLTERMNLPTVEIQAGRFALPKGVPVAQLLPEIKQKIPTEIVFAKTGGELIDFNIDLSITEKGHPRQKITTLSNSQLNLIVKPDKPVKKIRGYIIFKTKQPEKSSSNSIRIPLSSLTASLVFASPALALPQDKPVRVEEELVLLEFEYTDPDNDGIYTADIKMPISEGEYEIITVMDYEEPGLGIKEIRLTTIIDPEGYIFEKDRDKETRIPGAIISIYWLNPETKQYELWPAKEYQQENSQITDATGKYSFLVPQGSYYLKVVAPGYLIYDGKPFQVKEGSGVHFYIELKTKYWFLKIVDWKTILLVLVIVLLLYNFYRDKIIEKGLKKEYD